MSLTKIQAELNVPKGQTNSFGGYKYRSCEDILEAVKPLLEKYDCKLTVSDSIVEVGGRVYVEATASFTQMCSEKSDGEHVEIKAYAREPESKKGMDESQITGAASSYARKYALSGLFLIDDTKDADTQDNTQQTTGQPAQAGGQKSEPPGMTSEQVTAFYGGWNGKIYANNTVYWNDEPYQMSDAQVEWLKNQPKYKES